MVFLSTDIVNSSATCRQLGDSVYKEKLYDPHWAILNDCLSRNNGQFYENKGDGLLAIFPSAEDALACASEMQNRLNNPVIEYNSHRIAIRIGIHRAEVDLIPDETGKYRTGELNYVCRIESIANGNQILISDSTVKHLSNRTQLQWLEWQNRRIKSFDEEPVTVWELLWDGQSRGTPGSSWAPDWFTGDVSEYIARPELEKEISEAFGSKSAKTSRLVTLHGSGGTGKTRLALTCAVKMAGLFEGRVHFITFHQKPGEVTDGGSLLLQELRNTLGCEDAKLETVLITLALRGSSLFLIDNFESIAGESAQEVLIKILQRTKDVRLLVTGQKRTELADSEYVIELQNGMTESEGVALFIQRSRNIQHNWQPTETELADIRKIIALVEGVPLRIEFASAWLRKRDLKTIVHELETSPLGKFSALPSGTRFAATSREHHKSSELCLEYTCSLLTESHRGLFYRLGLFGGSFTVDTVEKACGIKDADELIDILLDSSLVSRFGNLQEYRYTMHRLTVSYCSRKFHERSDWQETTAQYVHFYAEQVKKVCTSEAIKLQSNYEFARLEWMNMKSAVMLGMELNTIEETLLLADYLKFYIRKERIWTEGIELYDALCKWYEFVENRDPEETASFIFEQAWYHKKLGKFAYAIELYSRALNLDESKWGSESEKLTQVLHELGDLHQRMLNHVESIQYYSRLISLMENHFGRNYPGIAYELVGMATSYLQSGKFSEAEPLLLRARDILELLPDREAHQYYSVLITLSKLYYRTGRFTEAEPLFQQALAVTERVHGKESSEVAVVLVNIGTMYQLLERHEEAIVNCERALAIAEKEFGVEHPNLESFLQSLAWSCLRLKRDEEALKLFNRDLAICLRVLGENHKCTGTAYNSIGLYYLQHGNYDDALRYLESSWTIEQKFSGPEHPENAILLCNIGSVLTRQGKYEEAEEKFHRAWTIHEKAVGRMHPTTSNMVTGLGTNCLRAGKYQEAEEYYRIALDIREQVFGNEHPRTTFGRMDLAKALYSQGKKTDAEAVSLQALEIFERTRGHEHQNTLFARHLLEHIQAGKDVIMLES